MSKIKHLTQLIILDVLAALLMITALAIGWLPGPGGIPLFLIGLSLLAINHDWAERYIDILKEHADKISDLIFLPRLRLFFDIVWPCLLIIGIVIIYVQSSTVFLSLGLFSLSMSLLTFFGNRDRWARFKKYLKARLRPAKKA